MLCFNENEITFCFVNQISLPCSQNKLFCQQNSFFFLSFSPVFYQTSDLKKNQLALGGDLDLVCHYYKENTELALFSGVDCKIVFKGYC